jgi:hypothetical protein
LAYDDASHCSPQYKRHFREPPVRDVERLHVRDRMTPAIDVT